MSQNHEAKYKLYGHRLQIGASEGITERAPALRFAEHLNSGTGKSLLQYRVVDGATGLSRTGARVWEQTLINQYGLQKNGGLLLNRINSISPKYWHKHLIK